MISAAGRARLIIELVRSRFVEFGWLLPALFPLAMVGGRGLFNTTFYLYICWAALALPGLRLPLPRALAAALALLLAAYLPSVLVAVDPARALKLWLTVLLYVSVAPITLAMLNRHPDKLDELLKLLGLGAVATLLACYADLAKSLLLLDNFVARLDLRAVELSFYLPFLLAWLSAHAPARWRKAAGTAALVALSVFVVVSAERGALVGLLAALAGLGLLVLRLRPAYVLAAILAVLALAFALNGEALLRGLAGGIDQAVQLDAFSSGRLTLWWQALQHPPANPWLGVGMGNVENNTAVITLNGHAVRHLHNLWLDAWYETGLLGLAALVGLFALGIAQAIRVWRRLDAAARPTAGLFMAAALALIAQTQFSLSYMSREFNIYTLLCLAVLMHLGARDRPPAASASPDRKS